MRSLNERVLISRQGTLWIFDKPAGLRVHPAGDDAADDLISWARREHRAPATLAPVHRLDAATSGLVLASSDAKERAEIGAAFAEGTVHKVYEALVFGRTHAKGVIDRPLDDPRRGRPLSARTRYKLLEAFGPFCSHLQVRPESGRKHQIRRHLRAIGHAVVGDMRYRDPKHRRVFAFPRRLWLHARALQLPDGRQFEAPLPAGLAAHLEILRTRREPA